METDSCGSWPEERAMRATGSRFRSHALRGRVVFGACWTCFAVLSSLVLLSVPAAADQRIVNGVLTNDFPTTGSLLLGNDPDTAFQRCTGTMIGCETFLTAAHCICDGTGASCASGQPDEPDPSDYLVFLQHGGFFSVSSIALRSDYSFPVADVAVLKLGAPVNGISPSEINTTSSPAASSSGTIVGFGRTGDPNFDYGIKQTGSVTTVACSGGISNTTSVCWSFTAPIGPPGDDSNSCNGDSGGPLFIDLGAGDVVAGVTSGGTSASCNEPDLAYDANVYHYRTWVNSEGGADLANATCGSRAQVESSDVDVHGFDGTLSAGKPTGTHSFTVDPGAEHLIVSMNGSEETSNDFDLYVKFASPPTPFDFDCAAFGTNSWASCEFPSPSAGSWHVLADRFDGAGTYQVTGTVFNPITTAPPTVPALPPWGGAVLAVSLAGAGAQLARRGAVSRS
jgi:hypothetical protein